MVNQLTALQFIIDMRNYYFVKCIYKFTNLSGLFYLVYLSLPNIIENNISKYNF